MNRTYVRERHTRHNPYDARDAAGKFWRQIVLCMVGTKREADHRGLLGCRQATRRSCDGFSPKVRHRPADGVGDTLSGGEEAIDSYCRRSVWECFTGIAPLRAYVLL
jgi:hypothetical protein